MIAFLVLLLSVHAFGFSCDPEPQGCDIGCRTLFRLVRFGEFNTSDHTINGAIIQQTYFDRLDNYTGECYTRTVSGTPGQIYRTYDMSKALTVDACNLVATFYYAARNNTGNVTLPSGLPLAPGKGEFAVSVTCATARPVRGDVTGFCGVCHRGNDGGGNTSIQATGPNWVRHRCGIDLDFVSPTTGLADSQPAQVAIKSWDLVDASGTPWHVVCWVSTPVFTQTFSYDPYTDGAMAVVPSFVVIALLALASFIN